MISYALRHGWHPDVSGATFVLGEHEHATGLVLPGFLVTDRLRTPHASDSTARVIHAYHQRQRS